MHTFAAHRDVFRALVSMAALDPDAVGGAMQRSEQRRAKGMMRLARRLARHGLLRDGLTAKQAADRLWVLTSFDAFDLLYTGRGLSADEVARVLVDMRRAQRPRPAPLRRRRNRLRSRRPAGPCRERKAR